MLQETKLDDSFPVSQFHLQGYELYPGACPGGGGPRGLPPPLEIENQKKKKKKRSSEQILSYFTYILLLF